MGGQGHLPNLLGDGIVLVLRQLAKLADETLEQCARGRELGTYVSARSLKGEAELDWDNPKERTRLLRGIVADADRLLAEVREVRVGLPVSSAQDANEGGGHLEPGATAGH